MTVPPVMQSSPTREAERPSGDFPAEPKRRPLQLRALRLLLVLATISAILTLWQICPRDSSVVIYVGKPMDMVDYLSESWIVLALAASKCFIFSIIALALAAIISTSLLLMGLLRPGGIVFVEGAAAFIQTWPLLAIMTILLVIQRGVYKSIVYFLWL